MQTAILCYEKMSWKCDNYVYCNYYLFVFTSVSQKLNNQEKKTISLKGNMKPSQWIQINKKNGWP